MFNPIAFLRRLVWEEDSEIDTRPSTSMHDLVIVPNAALANVSYNEIREINRSQSVVNYDIMREDEFDALAANWFSDRKDGGKATGVERYYFAKPTDMTIPEGAMLQGGGEQIYTVNEETTITAGAMSLNIENGLYYISVNITADEYGDAYNANSGEIVKSLYSVRGLVRVGNPYRISGGIQRESNLQYFERVLFSASTRNLLSKRSIKALILGSFNEIVSLIDVGKGDPEMVRDIMTVLIGGLPYDAHMGGMVDLYCNTNSYETITVDVDAEEVMIASKVRAKSITGNLSDAETLNDPNGQFVRANIANGDILTVHNDVIAGEYIVQTISGEGVLTFSPAAAAVIGGLDYVIEQPDSVGSWVSPILAVESINILDSTSLNPTGDDLSRGLGFKEQILNIIEDAGEHAICADGLDVIQCAFVSNGNVYVATLNQDMSIGYGPYQITDGGVNSTPDITAMSTMNIVVSWKHVSSSGGSDGIKISRIDMSDGSIIGGIDEQLVKTNDATHAYHSPLVTFNSPSAGVSSGLNLVYVEQTIEVDPLDNTFKVFYYRFKEDLSATPPFTDLPIYNGDIDIKSIGARSNDDYTMVACIEDSNLITMAHVDVNGNVIGGKYYPGNNAKVNNYVSVDINDGGDVVIGWSEGGKVMYIMAVNRVSGMYIDDTIVSSILGNISDTSVAIDVSGMIHSAFIDENFNSGDVVYSKHTQDMWPLIKSSTIIDQYRNSMNLSMVVDGFRRPNIVWDSSDNHDSVVAGCKRESQDYYLEPVDPNIRYSIGEMVNLILDEAVAINNIRINYIHPKSLEDITEVVSDRDSDQRVILADYVVKAPIPCFIDVTIEYSGDDELALTAVEDFINDHTGNELYVTDLLSVLELSVENRTNLPVVIYAEKHNIDGTVDVSNSENAITMPRTVKFIARRVLVV